MTQLKDQAPTVLYATTAVFLWRASGARERAGKQRQFALKKIEKR
jgi:hypothetical protein